MSVLVVLTIVTKCLTILILLYTNYTACLLFGLKRPSFRQSRQHQTENLPNRSAYIHTVDRDAITTVPYNHLLSHQFL